MGGLIPMPLSAGLGLAGWLATSSASSMAAPSSPSVVTAAGNQCHH